MVESPIVRISFRDFAQNPYISALHEGLATILPEAHWWIADENFVRYPFPGDGRGPYCPVSADDEARRDEKRLWCKEQYEKRSVSSCRRCSGPCCDGYLQGFSFFKYRGQYLGGVGVCHVESSRRTFLDSLLKIIEGYLSSLAVTLEDHDDLELVHTIWSETIAVIDLGDLLKRIMDELLTALCLDSGLILLVDEDGEFYPACVRNYPQSLLKSRNLDVTRYEYIEHMPSPSSSLLQPLSESDPLRLWFKRSIEQEGVVLTEENSACLAIPFFRNRYLIGLFLTFTDWAEGVSDTKQFLIRLLSTGGAAALDNALTQERMNQRRRALSTIHVVHRLISSSSITFKELLPKIGQLTRQLLKTKKCSIMLANIAKQQIVPEVALGLEKNEIGQKPLRMGEGLPGWVAENFNPVIYHPHGGAKPPWKDSGDAYPSECYMSAALFDNDIEGVITVADKDSDFTPGDREILVTFAEQAVIALRNARIHEGERTITVKALRSMANLIETHDPSRPGVTAITCHWAHRIARELHLNEREKRHITYAALLHDTGMLRAFQTEMTLDEQRMKGPQLSLRFVQSLGLPKDVGQIVYHVNEAWNGKGYPDGLKGNQIPLGSRIIAAAYTFAALLHRWNRESASERDLQERALRIVARLAGRAFDRDVVNGLEQSIRNPVKEDDFFI
ncbi:MAG: HD domain-containing phosphohydrolase [Candidatus Omnitrophota bacterium]